VLAVSECVCDGGGVSACVCYGAVVLVLLVVVAVVLSYVEANIVEICGSCGGEVWCVVVTLRSG
jgi:hypothetical protein